MTIITERMTREEKIEHYKAMIRFWRGRGPASLYKKKLREIEK